MQVHAKLSKSGPPLLAALVVLVLSCAVSAQQGTLGNIIGEVRVVKVGFPPKAVMVDLQNRGATVNSAYTDGQGRFGFYALPAGMYHLVIKDDDYVAADEPVDLNPLITATRYAQVTLNPKPADKQNTTSDRVPGGNPGLIDITEYLRKYPKKAVKEYEKGLEAAAAGNREAAEKHYLKSLELAPDFYPAHDQLGSLLLARGEFTDAEKELTAALKLNPGDADAHLDLANLQLLQRNYDPAILNAQEGLRKQPASAFGHFVLGSAFEHTGKLPEAERELRQALELNGGMATVHLELVNLYLAEQKKQQAAAELQVFLHDFPNDPHAAQAREVLSKLEK